MRLSYCRPRSSPAWSRCEIPGCVSSPDYPGYVWEDTERTKSCGYYEAVAGEDGTCARTNSTIKRTCSQGPYIFDDFEFSETTVTRFSILCGNEHFYKSVSLRLSPLS